MNIRLGNENLIGNTLLFEPNFEDPIEIHEFIRDLGILVANKVDFKELRSKIKETYRELFIKCQIELNRKRKLS